MVLNIMVSLSEHAELFLPKIYKDVVTDDHIEEINTHTVYLYLVYIGVWEATKPYLAIEI